MEDDVKGNGYQLKRIRKQLTQRGSSLAQLFRNSRAEENGRRFPRYMPDEIAELLTKKMARIYKKTFDGRKLLKRISAIINIPSLVHANSSRKLRQLAGSAV